jgi:integrase
MATIDPQTATLREVAEAYAKKSKRKDFVGPTIQYFKDIADEPGSALLLFQKDDEGRTLLARTLTSLPEDSPIKAAMQNIRQVGLLLKENIGPDTPEYKLLPDEKPDTDLNKRIFGRAEPAKAQSQVAISTDPKKQAQLFEGVSKFLDDPATRPAALAILFNLNTGLRPNAVLGLTLGQYYPDTGAVYVESDAPGAKGRAVNIPLNPVADSILQELLEGKKPGDRFFTKSTGAKVTTADVNKILRSVKVPQIMFDQATNTFYDSLHPEDGPGKTGSPLLRNVHSSVALSIGIPQERTAYLQGRSLKAASKGSTGEIATYQVPFPGEVSDIDREFSSQVSSFYGKSAKDAGFDIQSKIPMPESRITTQTPGYENYFDLPVKEEAPQPTQTSSAVKEGPSPELEDDLRRNSLNLSDIINNFGKRGAQIIVGAIGLETARQIVTEPAAVARDMAVEGALLAAKAPVAVAAAASMAMEPKQTAIQTLTEEERKNPQFTQNRPEPLADAEQEAMRDTGFVNIDRRPEAIPINQNQGASFLDNGR